MAELMDAARVARTLDRMAHEIVERHPDLAGAALVAPSPSGTGGQISVLGLLGVLAAWEEGLEINLLGLTFGVDVKDPALKIPIVGRLGRP